MVGWSEKINIFIYMDFISKTKIWLTTSAALVVASIALLAVFGLKLGIDFTGGSLLEVKYIKERPEISAVKESLSGLEIGDISIQPVGEKGFILKLKEISEEKHQRVLFELSSIGQPENSGENNESKKNQSAQAMAVTESGEEVPIEIGVEKPDGEVEKKEEAPKYNNKVIEELRFDSIGPSIGQELKRKSISAIIIVLVVIVLYIAWSFRKVSKPVASWKYGMAAIVALFHDVLITLGIFALLGRFAGVEIDTAFIAAILTVLGYSVNDTIVVFDRIRENLPRSEENFAGTVNTSLNQTIGRSINTSLTTLLVLLSIYFFGGETIRYFVLALVIGVISGTYSSIFLASPLLVVWEKWKK